MADFISHELVTEHKPQGGIRYELRGINDAAGQPVEGLKSAWIIIDNERQLNSYTTEITKELILAFRRASEARDVVAVVFTSVGNRSFCTGGNTREYAEYYAGRPHEYGAYMRLFNDMVSSILECDKPVICRVNGMRVAGGQEIGMACDFTVASDVAVFGQAGPKHGSAPVGGSTDFLPVFVGVERAMVSCTLCQMWTAYEAKDYGLIAEVVPVLKDNGKFVPNPTVITDRLIDDMGQKVYGKTKEGAEFAEAKAKMKTMEVDLSLLDEKVDALLTSLALTMPGCLTKTVEEVRKHKLQHWDKNRESSRAWLGLNMMNEARLGFRAFNEGPRGNREIDYLELRRRLAQDERWGESLIEALIPKAED